MSRSKLIRGFSIQTNSEGRAELAKELFALRATLAQQKKELEALQQIDTEFLLHKSWDLELQEGYISQKGFHPIKKSKIKNKIKALQMEVVPKLPDKAMMELLGFSAEQKPKDITSAFIEKLRRAIRDKIESRERVIASIDIGGELQEFYKEEARKFGRTGFTFAEMEQTFKSENLAKLSLEDYTAILGKFPGDILTHVTRQGIRDHTGMMWHTAGVGEVHNGFKEILAQGELRATIQAREGKMTQAEAIGKSISTYRLPTAEEVRANDGIKSRKEILSALHRELADPNNAPSPTNGHFSPLFDKTSVHFAVSGVLDNLYGGERGNECFFVFPQAMAMNCEYQGTLFQRDPHSQWNDLGLLPPNGKGFPLEAGLVFAPKNAQVDPETGSKYKIVDGKPILTGKDKDGNPQYVLAEKTISSQEYWEKYISEHCQGQKLKVIYYDVSLSPTEAINEFKRQHGIDRTSYQGRFMDRDAERKHAAFRAYMMDKESIPEVDYNVKAKIESIIDVPAFERAVNEHFDKLEQDPQLAELLKQRDKDMWREYKRPVKTIEQTHAARALEVQLYSGDVEKARLASLPKTVAEFRAKQGPRAL